MHDQHAWPGLFEAKAQVGASNIINIQAHSLLIPYFKAIEKFLSPPPPRSSDPRHLYNISTFLYTDFDLF